MYFTSQRAVIGIGNDYRHDDGVGLEVARLVLRAGPDGARVVIGASDDYALLAAWEDCERVYVIDCTQSGAVPGTIRSFDARENAIPTEIFTSFSTHTLNLAKTIDLSRTLDKLPHELTIFGVEGADLSLGHGLTAKVQASAIRVADLIVRYCAGARDA